LSVLGAAEAAPLQNQASFARPDSPTLSNTGRFDFAQGGLCGPSIEKEKVDNVDLTDI